MRVKHASRLAAKLGMAFTLAGGGLTACSLDNLLKGDDPAEGIVVDPNAVTTYTGALSLYYSSIEATAIAAKLASEDVGTFTDELAIVTDVGTNRVEIDGRVPSVPGQGVLSQAYPALQTARIRAAQASEMLLRYGTPAANPLIGHAYAMQAHAITQMAEMFCSGVPLTNVPFGGELQYTAGFSTTALLERAVALFDTAYTYGKDSLPIATFAQVGRGRALLGLGRYADAAAAVADVPTSAQYALQYSLQPDGVVFWVDLAGGNGGVDIYRVLSREGGNGIRWTADSARLQDPRVPLSSLNDELYTDPIRELKYTSGSATFVVASGIQARMIEAEAQLQPAANPAGPWLATLNAARATLSLPPLTDPGTAAGRIDLLFRERAFWFYLSGQRLGDMRRLVRQYGRLPIQVYPVGLYPRLSLQIPTYGDNYVFELPPSEQNLNPLYKGCTDAEP